jgi:hypothetical protein
MNMSSITSTNIAVVAGDDKTLTITFVDSAGGAVNITGYTAFLTVKTNLTDADVDAKIAKSWTVHSDPTHGITSVALVPADTLTLLGAYYFDVQLKSGGGLIRTPVRGTFTVLDNITIRTT